MKKFIVLLIVITFLGVVFEAFNTSVVGVCFEADEACIDPDNSDEPDPDYDCPIGTPQEGYGPGIETCWIEENNPWLGDIEYQGKRHCCLKCNITQDCFEGECM